jgi:hypothetical protein
MKPVLAAICLITISCAESRIQPVIKTAWLSKAGDSASLAQLKLLDLNKATPVDDGQFVQIERGTAVFSTVYSSDRCGRRAVFQKVEVTSGKQKGAQGWMCGASISHHKAPAL